MIDDNLHCVGTVSRHSTAAGAVLLGSTEQKLAVAAMAEAVAGSAADPLHPG